MRYPVANMRSEEIMERFGVSRTTAWRTRKRGWLCTQKEHASPMTEADGEWVLDVTSWVRDDDLRSNAILRLVELWGDVIQAANRAQYAARITVNEIKRRRRIGPPRGR